MLTRARARGFPPPFLAANINVRLTGYLDGYLVLFWGLQDVLFGCDEN